MHPPRIIVNSVPKSGTNLLTKLLSMLPGLKNAGLHLGNATLMGERDAGEVTVPVGVDMPVHAPLHALTGTLELRKAGEFVSAHLPFSEPLAAYLKVHGFKMVMIVRHPGDVAVSHATYLADNADHPMHGHYAALSREEQLLTSINGVTLPQTTLLSLNNRFDAVLKWAEHDNVLLLKFEDLVGEEGGGGQAKQWETIKTLASFLGILIDENRLQWISDNLFGGSKTFRSGQIGSWKKEFTPQLTTALQRAMGDRYNHLGYVAPGKREDVKKEISDEAATLNTSFSDNRLIFLVSQPRSGSTLLQRVLGGHDMVHTLAEPWIMLHPLYALKTRGIQTEYNAGLAHDGLEDFISSLPRGRKDYVDGIRQMALTWYGCALADGQKKFFLDKTPRYYLIIPELQETFPASKIVLLFRNPLSVLSSILKTWVGKNWGRLQMHRDDLLRAPALLVAGRDMLKERAITLCYEDFIRAPEARLKHLCASLEILYDPEMLNYGENPVPRGRMGDSVGIKKYTRPTPASLDSWKETFVDPAYRLLAEIMLTLIGPEVIGKMGYSYNTLWQLLREVQPLPQKIAPAEMSAMIAALHLSSEKIAQIDHLFGPYIDADSRVAVADFEPLPV